ncbi:mycothiol synthase [Agreia sp. VKM Ac-1783]|uniref:mycothiol synthase n=1 Tax=Agreia sp. VKM Ac-1783 TaxID=1938889 RepID=UPI000A2AC8F6|nr:mycothiol synthase [Agreia sp. VKM Ac-1783]SMQ71834.1 mycothiol synthase [Agreia sp. VKM Ac-1783]
MSASLQLRASNPAELGAAFTRLISRSSMVDGQPPFNDQALVDAASGARSLVVAEHGDVIAGAVLIGNGEFEFVVDPEFRRNGLGTILLERILDGAEPDIAGWAHGDHPASRILAERTGFEPIRTLYQLRMPVPGSPSTGSGNDGLGAAAGDDGIVVDAFRPGIDDEAWVELNARVFADHPEQGSITVDDLHARMAESWFDADDFLVARQGDKLIAYNWLKVEGPDEPGEIYVVGVDSDYAGRGLGRMLMERAFDRLREGGISTAALYVDADNVGAVHLYRSLGFTDHTVDVQYRRPLAG